MAVAAIGLIVVAGCATDVVAPEPPTPAQVRARVERLLPAKLRDRSGWAADIQVAFTALEIEPSVPNVCAALAVTEQESSYRADPSVPNLGKITWAEIDRRAERLGIPPVAVRFALQLPSQTGKRYSERIDEARTEKALSEIFEDFIGMVPLGKRLFGGLNPVRTGGPMQVSVRFAQRHAQEHGYPYEAAGSIRNEVFTRRGGMYFGIAHLLDYPAPYDRHLYRFADFNAGHYASRNAAFQRAVSVASGIALDLDGDLVRHGDAKPGSTELAVRALAGRLDMDERAIRRALEQGDRAGFERTTLYARVFELADRAARRPLPRTVLPRIALKGPKISRKLTTEWFAKRVDGRYQRCLARGGVASTPADA